MSHYGPRMKKSEKPDKSQIVIHFPHNTEYNPENLKSLKEIRLASIDPARKNYALRIERWDYVNQIVQPIIFDKFDLTNKKKEEEDNVVKMESIYTNLSAKLDFFKNEFKFCNIFVIEKQPPLDYKTNRISQHTISYFIENFKNTDLCPLIIEVDPKYRCKVLGAPKLAYNPLKDWMIAYAINTFKVRNDQISLSIINKIKKKDDLADTACQNIGIMKYFGIYFEPLPINDTHTNFFQGENFKTKKKSGYVLAITKKT